MSNKISQARFSKISLIRDAERTIGFKRFKVNFFSSDEEIDNVLQFIETATSQLNESFLPQIEKLLTNG